MTSIRTTRQPWTLFALLVMATSCENDSEPSTPLKNISYVQDGSQVKYGDPSPIALDINSDGSVDFTIFMELTANGDGDHLYAGINPIGNNLIKSGPSDDDRFLNMGFLIEESLNTNIDNTLLGSHRWTDDHSTLVIRNTHNNGSISYEGAWSADAANIVGIQYASNGKTHFGWLRLTFDKATETVTLIDYAYEKRQNQSIKAGDH